MMIRASHRPSERFRIVPSPCGLRLATKNHFLSVIFFVPQTYHMFERISSVFSNSYQIVIKAPLIHNNSLPLGLVLTALRLVNAVVIDLMLLAVHILTSLVKNVTCIVKQVAYTDDDPCVQPLLDGA